MQMKCDKLMQDALNLHIDPEARAALNAMRKPAISGYTPKEGVGIDINSKLMTALEKIKQTHTSDKTGNLQFRPETIRKLLQREGVSKGEIETSLSRILDNPTYHENGKVSIDYLTGAGRVSKVNVTDFTKEGYAHAETSFNLQGLHPDNNYQVRHAQSRVAEGITQEHFPEVRNSLGWARQYKGNMNGKPVWRLDEIQSDFFQNKPKDEIQAFMKETGISYDKVKKILIIDALDQAIQNGLDTLVIPITRELNNLQGSANVTKIYRELNNGILPKIRQELDKNGLKIEVKKELTDTDVLTREYTMDMLFSSDSKTGTDAEENFWDEVVSELAFNSSLTKEELFKGLKDFAKDGNYAKEEIDGIRKSIESMRPSPEEAFVISIKDKPGKPNVKARWDALSVAGALGLGEAYNKLQEQAN